MLVTFSAQPVVQMKLASRVLNPKGHPVHQGGSVKKLIVALVVLSLLLAGCAPSPVQQAPIPETDSTVVLPREPPEDVTWISPGKVQVGNFYPGARAEWDLLIHNGDSSKATFEVKYRYPDHVGEGYAFPSDDVQDWVIIADSTPVLMPKETRSVLVVLAMPKGATSPAPKWEFWISVIEITQRGMVRTELASRWLVTMRD